MTVAAVCSFSPPPPRSCDPVVKASRLVASVSVDPTGPHSRLPPLSTAQAMALWDLPAGGPGQFELSGFDPPPSWQAEPTADFDVGPYRAAVERYLADDDDVPPLSGNAEQNAEAIDFDVDIVMNFAFDDNAERPLHRCDDATLDFDVDEALAVSPEIRAEDVRRADFGEDSTFASRVALNPALIRSSGAGAPRLPANDTFDSAFAMKVYETWLATQIHDYYVVIGADGTESQPEIHALVGAYCITFGAAAMEGRALGPWAELGEAMVTYCEELSTVLCDEERRRCYDSQIGLSAAR